VKSGMTARLVNQLGKSEDPKGEDVILYVANC